MKSNSKSLICVFIFYLILLILPEKAVFGNGSMSVFRIWMPIPLKHEGRRIKLEIEDGLAMVEIEDSFKNPNERRLEGIYRFTLPNGAFTSGFDIMTDGKTWVPGKIMDISKARLAYNTIVSRETDPGLLEQHGNELLIRVFPIEATSTAKIRFKAHFGISASREAIETVLPFEIDPPPEDSEFSPFTGQPKPQGTQIPATSFEFSGKIRDSRGIKTIILEPVGLFKPIDKGFSFSIFHESAPQKSLHLKIQLGSTAGPLVTGFQNSLKERFLLVRVPSLAQPKAILHGIRAVIDTSGSMGGKNRRRIEAVLKALRQVYKDGFSIFVQENKALKRVSDAEFSKLKCRGPTDWNSFRNMPDFESATGYFLITDGEDISPREIKTLWTNWGRKPLWLLLFRENPSQSLTLSAQEAGGCIQFFSPDDESRLEKKILSAVTDISLGAKIIMPQGRSSLPLYGRLSSLESNEAFFVIPARDWQNEIKISNRQDETVETFSDPGSANDREISDWISLLPVRQLIMTLQAKEQTKNVIEEITNLGLSKNLVTDYTAFLAVPDDVAAKHADALNPAFLAAFAIPNFKKAREQARGKACYANLRVLMGAIEMYNMDNQTPFPNDPVTCMIDEKLLLEGSYIKSSLSRPETNCDYRFGPGGTLASNSAPFCLAHGFVDDWDVSTLEESFIKRGADPYLFDIDFSQFKISDSETPLKRWLEKARPLLYFLLLFI